MAEPLEITPAEYAARREAFASRLRDDGLAGAVLFDTPHVQYLCGAFLFPTERPIAFVLSAEGEPGLLVPRLELEHARAQTGLERIEHYLEYRARSGPRPSWGGSWRRLASAGGSAPTPTAIRGSWAIAGRR